MSKIEFQWQVGGESGEWETIAETKKRPRRRWSWRVWVVLAAILIVLSAAGYALIRQRFVEANQLVTFQIQSVIDQETQAWNRRDLDLYLRQQDDANPDWYSFQKRLIDAHLEQTGADDRLPAKIQDVNVQGNIAWVETIEDNEPVRRMRFYRQTNRGWLHTAPDPRFWGHAVEYHYGEQLIFRYHERDQPTIDPLVEQLAEAFYEICAIVDCAPAVFEVNVALTVSPDGGPRNTTLILSPWISGIPLEGDWSDTLAERALYDLAWRIVRSRFPTVRMEQNSLTSALVDEFASWTSTQDLAQAPLLGRVIARHGQEVLPELFDSLEHEPSLELFLGRWFFLSPTPQNRALIFFETLLNIEREAFLTGRRETFMFLQDPEGLMWLDHQAYLFDRATAQQRQDLSLPVIEIDDIVLAQDYAIIDTGASDILYSRPVTVFLLRDGDWKRNDFAPVPIQ